MEAEFLRKRVQWGTRLRWVAIVGVVVISLIAGEGLGYVEPVWPLYVIALCMGGYNIALAWLATGASPQSLPRFARAQIFLDTTERRELQRQVIHQEKMAALGQMAAGIAHEVGNPLASISAVLQALVRKNPPYRGDLQELRDHVDRIGRIVASVSSFSRKAAEKRESIVLQGVVEQAIQIAQLDRRWKGVRLHGDFGEDLPIPANRDQLLQVFLNILLNALDAMPKGGELRVHVQRQGARAEVSFSDSGVGMTPQVRARLFEPFFTTKPPGMGTGLGLTVSRRIMEDHGGEIRVGGQAGPGSTFTVSLPLEVHRG
jgi:signal transduction histidine kinase